VDLKEYCCSLNENQLLKLAIKLCDKALFIWDDYASNHGLSYRDSVVGLSHTIRPQLLADAIGFCKMSSFYKLLHKGEFDKLFWEFREPIVAMQDLDWELPYPVERTFYAVNNLLGGHQEKVTVFDELTYYVAVNQAVDALAENGTMEIEEIRKLIYD
jgi:hypothetical protein